MSSTDRSRANLPRAEQRQALIAQQLVEDAGGGAAASAVSGKSEAQLSKYGRSNYAESMPVAVVETLESVTHGQPGHPRMTRYLARQQGYVLVPLPETVPGEGQWNRHIARLSEEAGGLISGLAMDLADDQDVSPREASERLADAGRLVEVAVEIEAALKAKAAEGR